MRKWWYISLAVWLAMIPFIFVTGHASSLGSLARAIFLVAGAAWCVLDIRDSPLRDEPAEDFP